MGLARALCPWPTWLFGRENQKWLKARQSRELANLRRRQAGGWREEGRPPLLQRAAAAAKRRNQGRRRGGKRGSAMNLGACLVRSEELSFVLAAPQTACTFLEYFCSVTIQRCSRILSPCTETPSFTLSLSPFPTLSLSFPYPLSPFPILSLLSQSSLSFPNPLSNLSTGELTPLAINVMDFAEARATELKAMTQVLSKKPGDGGKRVFQQLPRHMRRRAMSHNIRRLPRRLQEKAAKEVCH